MTNEWTELIDWTLKQQVREVRKRKAIRKLHPQLTELARLAREKTNRERTAQEQRKEWKKMGIDTWEIERRIWEKEL